MSATVHIANTNVEFEFAHPYPSSLTLEHHLSKFPLCLQLQFLPLLYAQPNDLVAVTALPPHHYLDFLHQTEWWPYGLPQLALLQAKEPFEGKRCLAWGVSRQVQTWAEARHMQYAAPNWSLACLVNSKAFSFRYNRLGGTQLIENEAQLNAWLQQVSGEKVLKTCFGLAGQGNWVTSQSTLSSCDPRLLAFAQHEWQQKRPLIGEPWVKRVCDFSTQWLIHSNRQIEAIGSTRFDTDDRGTYLGTLAGPEKRIFESFYPFLMEHRHFVQAILEEISEMGFFGFLGIDALVYLHPMTGALTLYPVVEINARQTMSLVALRLQQRLCPNKILRFALQAADSQQPSFLPSQLVNRKGKLLHFGRRLALTIL